MLTARPSHLLDPVCGMTVDVARAEAAGLLLEHDGRTYAFCGRGCRRSFVEEPDRYTADADHAADAALGHGHDAVVPRALPVIDAGMRSWYESCSCCLSEAFPEVKAQLDAEKLALAQAPAGPGACEVIEAAAAATGEAASSG